MPRHEHLKDISKKINGQNVNIFFFTNHQDLMLFFVNKVERMGQKIHPLGLRLGTTQKHRSTWFALKKFYPRWFKEDLLIRKYLLKTYPTARIVDIKIIRAQMKETPKQMLDQQIDEKQLLGKKTREKPKRKMERKESVQVLIETPYIRNIVGIETPKKQVQELCSKLVELCEKDREKRKAPIMSLKVLIRPVNDPYNEASMIADDLIEQLEKRTSFRAALKGTLDRVKKNDQEIKNRIKMKQKAKRLKGTRIQISGRLNGAEIARIEWRRKGRIPLHTLRADVGYAAKTAKTIHGILGIKVWTFTKEKF